MDPKDMAVFQLNFQENEEKCFDDYRWANIKYLCFSDFSGLVKKDQVILYQDFRLNKGGIFWDGSYLLLKYFLQNYSHEQLEKKWILELGSGTSLPSIVLALMKIQVVITDLKYLIEFVKKNVSLNLDIENARNLFIKDLEWGNEKNMNEIKLITKKFDFILCSELIYIEESFDDLILTLQEFSDEKTIILFSYRMRMKEKFQNFIEKLEKSFEVKYIERKYLENLHPNEDLYLMTAQIKK